MQLRGVAHLAAVDIDLGGTTAKDIDLSVRSGHVGYLVQQVLGRAGLLQHTADHGGNHGVAFQTRLGQFALHRHLAQHPAVRLEGQGADTAAGCTAVEVGKAHARNAQQAALAAVSQVEGTLGIAHPAGHKGRVGQGEQHDVGILYGMLLFVHQPSADSGILCMRQEGGQAGSHEEKIGSEIHHGSVFSLFCLF